MPPAGLFIAAAAIGIMVAAVWFMSWGLLIAGVLLAAAAYRADW